MTISGDIGLIGLAVMGQNLAMNMADHGFAVVVHNRTPERTTEFLTGPAAGMSITGAETPRDLTRALATPRRIVLMVKAGQAVDTVIEALIPYLDPGDVIIDGGNSFFQDSIRRAARLEEQGLLFVGTGISGGEEGARHGPSIMPGGSPQAWPLVRNILQGIAAKLADGTPCCDWVGPNGAGHYVKMVHNGIEYGDIQLLAEAYDIMHTGLGMTHDEMADVLSHWNTGRLRSYLVEITADVMRFRHNGEPLLDKIVDAAGQKGTGRWTVESALQLGSPVTLISEAVFARSVSALKEERVIASHSLAGPQSLIEGHREAILSDLESALYASKIVSYTQGFTLLRAAAEEYDWELDLGGIALMWREGCIIRAAFLEGVGDAFTADRNLSSLLLDPVLGDAVQSAQEGWRRTVARAVIAGIPMPAYSSALSFFDSYRTERLPANLIQALRDYFGAHSYERTDRNRGEWFHTDWTGKGGDVSAGSYNA